MMPAGPTPASKLTVFDSVDRLGMWSLPGRASPLCGKVEYDQDDGARLRVMEHAGAIALLQKGLDGTQERLPAIRGVLETGEHVLLDECSELAKNIYTVQEKAGAAPGGEEIPAGTTSVANTTYMARQMYMSRAPVPDRPKFARMSVSYTSLFTWLNDYSISTKLNEDMSATITFTPPVERRTTLSDDLSVTILHGHSVRISGAPRKEFRLPQSAAIMFETPQPVGIDWFYPHVSIFANFLMMGTGVPVQPEAFRMPYNDDTVTVFPSYRTHAGLDREGDLFKMHFNYQEIAGAFDRAITSWFSMHEKYSKSMDIYFQTRLDDPMLTMDIKFIRLVQGLEAFHRAKYPDKYSKGERTTIREAVGGLVSDLPYEVFGNKLTKSDFLSTVATTRNYFSHGFIRDREQDMPGHARLAHMIQRSDLLLYGCYLDGLDIDGGLKRGIMEKKLRYADQLVFF